MEPLTVNLLGMDNGPMRSLQGYNADSTTCLALTRPSFCQTKLSPLSLQQLN